MKRASFFLLAAGLLIIVTAVPSEAQHRGSDNRHEFMRTLVRPDVLAEDRRAFAARPGVDTMLIALMTDSRAVGRARLEAAMVLAYVETPPARAFIEEAIHRNDLAPELTWVLIHVLPYRPDRFGVRIVERALKTGSQTAKLAAISALRGFPPERERVLLLEAANDADPIVANAAKLRLEGDRVPYPPGSN